MIDVIWTLIKITVVTAVGYVCIRWILTKAGMWEPVSDAIAVIVRGILKGFGWGG